MFAKLAKTVTATMMYFWLGVIVAYVGIEALAVAEKCSGRCEVYFTHVLGQKVELGFKREGTFVAYWGHNRLGWFTAEYQYLSPLPSIDGNELPTSYFYSTPTMLKRGEGSLYWDLVPNPTDEIGLAHTLSRNVLHTGLIWSVSALMVLTCFFLVIEVLTSLAARKQEEQTEIVEE